MTDLAPHIGEIARLVLGPENRQRSTKAELRFGTNGSMSVKISGEKSGQWYDHELQVGGGALDLLREKLGLVDGAASEWLQRHGFDKANNGSSSGFNIVAEYDYPDAAGQLLYQVCRLAPKDFRHACASLQKVAQSIACDDGVLDKRAAVETSGAQFRDYLAAFVPVGEGVIKALAEVATNLAVAKALTATMEDTNMYTDVQKAAALTVVQKFNARVEEVAQRDRIGHGAAMNKIAATSYLVNAADAALWSEYRQASEVVKADPVAPALAPAPMVSAAYAELTKRAAKLRKRDPKLSEASAFAKAYSDPANRDLAEADRQAHFNKAAGGAQLDSKEQLIQAAMEVLGCDRAHASGVDFGNEVEGAADDIYPAVQRRLADPRGPAGPSG